VPAARLFRALALITLLLPAAALVPWIAAAALVADALLLAAYLIDLRRARAAGLEAHREWPPLLVQGTAAEVLIETRTVETRSPVSRSLVPRPVPSRTITVRLREGLTPALAGSPVRRELRLAPGGADRWAIPLAPCRRGEHPSGPLTARVLGPWGLAWAQRELLPAEPRRVYPRVRWEGEVGHLLALAHRRRLGSAPQRLHGVGTEPYALRSYLPGDPLARIHWKATARHGKLISREDTWERGTRLAILLDCARAMAAPDGTGPAHSKLDSALAAALALVRVAAARGDRVTLIAFSDRIERRVAVTSGRRSLARAYRSLYDLEARRAEPAFDLAAEAASALGGRSGTAVILTSVVDLAAAELLRGAALRLERRYRVLLVNLEDPELARLAEDPPAGPREAFAQVAALEIALANRRLARRLRGAGVRVTTTPADRLALTTLEAYLARFQGGQRSSQRRAV
jgi:uncharacterized protein (DUF58 family)